MHRFVNKSYAVLAAIITFVGSAILISHNVAFLMLVLSNKYAAATFESQISQIIAAGQTLLTLREHSSPLIDPFFSTDFQLI